MRKKAEDYGNGSYGSVDENSVQDGTETHQNELDTAGPQNGEGQGNVPDYSTLNHMSGPQGENGYEDEAGTPSYRNRYWNGLNDSEQNTQSLPQEMVGDNFADTVASNAPKSSFFSLFKTAKIACGKCGRTDYNDIRGRVCDDCAFPDKKDAALEPYKRHQKGPAWVKQHPGKPTARYTLLMRLPVAWLKNLPGLRGEDEVLTENMSSIKDIAKKIVDKEWQREHPIEIGVQHDGDVTVDDGNHRIRAAMVADVDSLLAKIKFYGGGEKNFDLDKILEKYASQDETNFLLSGSTAGGVADSPQILDDGHPYEEQEGFNEQNVVNNPQPGKANSNEILQDDVTNKFEEDRGNDANPFKRDMFASRVNLFTKTASGEPIYNATLRHSQNVQFLTSTAGSYKKTLVCRNGPCNKPASGGGVFCTPCSQLPPEQRTSKGPTKPNDLYVDKHTQNKIWYDQNKTANYNMQDQLQQMGDEVDQKHQSLKEDSDPGNEVGDQTNMTANPMQGYSGNEEETEMFGGVNASNSFLNLLNKKADWTQVTPSANPNSGLDDIDAPDTGSSSDGTYYGGNSPDKIADDEVAKRKNLPLRNKVEDDDEDHYFGFIGGGPQGDGQMQSGIDNSCN